MKRVVALAVSIIMLIMVFSGCGAGNGAKGDEASKAADGGNATNQGSKADNGKNVQKEATLRLFIPTGTDSLDYGSDQDEVFNTISDKIFKDTGFKLKFTINTASYDNLLTKVNLLIASNDIDAFNSRYQDCAKWIMDDNLLMPLNDIISEYGRNLKEDISKDVLDIVTVKGQIRAVPRPAIQGNDVMIWIRKDLLDQVNLPIPKTVTEFENALRAMKAKFPDIIPLASSQTDWETRNQFYGLSVPDKQTDDNGNLLPCIGDAWNTWFFKSPEYRSYLSKIAGWYKEGLLNKEIFTWDRNKKKEMMWKGKVGAWVDGSWMQGDFDHLAKLDDKPLKPEETYMNLVGITLTKDDGKPVHMGYGNSLDRVNCVLKTCKCPEAVITVLDWAAAAEENSNLLSEGIEKKHHNMVNGMPIPVEGLDKLYNGILGNMFGPSLKLSRARSSNKPGAVRTDYQKITDGTKYPQVFAIDNIVLYDFTSLGSLPTTLETYFKQETTKIFLGEKSINAMDDIIKKLDEMGYDRYYQERNRQFKAWTTK